MLNGKIVIVTGGASGIGAATADHFSKLGAIVLAADIAATASHRLDVTDPASCAALADLAIERHGRIDGLVHCAGIGADTPFLEMRVEDFDRIIAVNLRGSFLIGQACAQRMGAGGAIVNIASVSGMRGNTGRAAYGASKGGVITLSQVMATELAARGIRVNVIAPGPVETPLVAAVHDAAIRRSWTDVVPMGRYGTPLEIAASAAFLCSEAASYITGHVLAVDGGFLAGGIHRRRE